MRTNISETRICAYFVLLHKKEEFCGAVYINMAASLCVCVCVSVTHFCHELHNTQNLGLFHIQQCIQTVQYFPKVKAQKQHMKHTWERGWGRFKRNESIQLKKREIPQQLIPNLASPWLLPDTRCIHPEPFAYQTLFTISPWLHCFEETLKSIEPAEEYKLVENIVKRKVSKWQDTLIPTINFYQQVCPVSFFKHI